MNKTEKKNPITVSKRNVHILITLCRGPITFYELKEICFKKDDEMNYKLFKKEKDRSIYQKRDDDPYTSRQFCNRKLAKLENRELIGTADYFEISSYGMPKKEKIYYLTEKGCHHVCRSFNIHKHDVRYGPPLNIHMDHEINLSRILRKIYYDAECKHYQVQSAHADRALRSIFQARSGGMSPKGMYFVDLRIKVIYKSGRQLEIPVELANIKDDPDFWKNKISHIQEPFFILTKNEGFVKVICRWIQEIKLDHVMFVAPLGDFLRLGFMNTIWHKVSPGEVQMFMLDLDA